MRRAGHALAWAASVGTLLGVAVSAGAEQPVAKPLPRDPAAAAALFEQGRRALAKNDLVRACAKYSTVDTARARRSPSLGVSASPSGFALAYRSRF